MNLIPESPASKKWTVYITTHKNIFPELYSKDSNFNSSNYKFINISSNPLKITNQLFHVINLPKEPGYIPMGDYYYDSRVIYNIYKNQRFYEGLDFIGFLHYDFEFKLPDGSGNVTKKINKYLRDKTKAHISFSTHNIQMIYNQRILADEKQPNTLSGSGYNCIDYILNDYNNYFHTSYTLNDLYQKHDVNMCSCFLIDVHRFIKMMKFISSIIESKKLKVFDRQHILKIHGHLLERYFGVFLMLKYDQFLNLPLPHLGHLKHK